MAIHPDETLQRFLAAVEELRAERAGTLDAAVVLEIARELGLSDQDLAAARSYGELLLERGRTLLTAGLGDEAVRCLTQADALLPDDPRVLVALGTARRTRTRRRFALAGTIVALMVGTPPGSADRD